MVLGLCCLTDVEWGRPGSSAGQMEPPKMERSLWQGSLAENYRAESEVGSQDGQDSQVRGSPSELALGTASPSKHFTAEFSFHPPKILSLQRAKPSLLCSLRLPALSLSLWSSGAARRSRGRAQHWGFEQAQIPSLGKDSLSRLPPCRLTPYKKGHSG